MLKQRTPSQKARPEECGWGGTDLRYIQEIPGHKNSRTTEIYKHPPHFIHTLKHLLGLPLVP